VRLHVQAFELVRDSDIELRIRLFVADWPRFQDTCKKWSQGQLERERLGVEGEGQYVHVQDVLAETSDVLAHVGAEARQHGFEVFISPHYFYPTDKGRSAHIRLAFTVPCRSNKGRARVRR
jgi:hypothetical protein